MRTFSLSFITSSQFAVAYDELFANQLAMRLVRAALDKRRGNPIVRRRTSSTA